MPDVWPFYEKLHRAFDRDRSRSPSETKHLAELAALLPRDSEVLDLGCGGGEPVARYLADRGCRLTGVDAAPSMIALCRSRLPEHDWIVADMRGIDLGRRYHAVVAWDSFFHLPASDQRAMFGVFAKHLLEPGLLLLTSGPAAGEVWGSLYGEPLFHASLDESEYRSLLAGAHFAVLRHVVEDPDCGGRTVWLARLDPKN